MAIRGSRGKNNYLFSVSKGKFGVVYHCTEKKTGKKLAAKFITTINKQERENVEREVSIMCELQHPKILQLYDAYDDGKEMCMIMELSGLFFVLFGFLSLMSHPKFP